MYGARRERLTALIVGIVNVVAAGVNYFDGDIGLRPLGTICTLLFAVATGLIPGLIFAIFSTAMWVSVGYFAAWTSPAARNPLTTLIFLVVNIVGVVMASALRRGVAQNAALAVRLQASEREHERLHELGVTRARLVESERRFRSVAEFIPFGIWQTDDDDQLTYLSRSYLDMLGMTLEQVRAGGWTDRVPPEDRERFMAAWQVKRDRPPPFECEYRIRGADGALYTIQSRGIPLTGDAGEAQGWIGVSYDVTSARRAVEKLNFLAEAGRLLTSSLDPDTTLERIAALCVPQLADWCTVDILDEDGKLSPAAVRHSDPAKVEWAKALQREYPRRQDEANASYQVVRTGQPVLVPDVSDDMLVHAARDERELTILRELGLSSAMVVPLNARGRQLGVVTFIDSESKRRFDQTDLEFAVILCARAALAYDNARLFSKEQRVAETFQAASLPTELPQLPGVRISATYRAGRNESEVGGDWYDAFELPDGKLVVSIGDVSGKGLAAAVAMSAVRQILSASAFEGAGPADMLKRCNRVVCHRGSGIVTAAVGVLTPESRTFVFASAGHPPILYARAAHDVTELSTHGIPLGVVAEYTYSEESIVIDSSSVLVLYTDGLTEFAHDVETGEQTLRRVVRELADASPPGLAEAIVRGTVAGRPLDDIAVLALELHADQLQSLDIVVPATVGSARTVRRSLRRLCLANALNEDQTFRVLVAAGEAVSNAIEHAYLDEPGTIHVLGTRKDGCLHIEVADEGRWRAGQRNEGGRGLQLMQRLMDNVVIERTETGTAIRQRLHLDNAHI